jgi:hypothetical protein
LAVTNQSDCVPCLTHFTRFVVVECDLDILAVGFPADDNFGVQDEDAVMVMPTTVISYIDILPLGNRLYLILEVGLGLIVDYQNTCAINFFENFIGCGAQIIQWREANFFT